MAAQPASAENKCSQSLELPATLPGALAGEAPNLAMSRRSGPHEVQDEAPTGLRAHQSHRVEMWSGGSHPCSVTCNCFLERVSSRLLLIPLSLLLYPHKDQCNSDRMTGRAESTSNDDKGTPSPQRVDLEAAEDPRQAKRSTRHVLSWRKRKRPRHYHLLVLTLLVQ